MTCRSALSSGLKDRGTPDRPWRTASLPPYLPRRASKQIAACNSFAIAMYRGGIGHRAVGWSELANGEWEGGLDSPFAIATATATRPMSRSLPWNASPAHRRREPYPAADLIDQTPRLAPPPLRSARLLGSDPRGEPLAVLLVQGAGQRAARRRIGVHGVLHRDRGNELQRPDLALPYRAASEQRLIDLFGQRTCRGEQFARARATEEIRRRAEMFRAQSMQPARPRRFAASRVPAL